MHSYKVQTKDKILLHAKKWSNNKKPKGTICIIHGLGEHQDRYIHVAEFYITNGFQVYSYDQRGHGRSEGKRGHSPGLDYNIDDLERVLKTIPCQHLFLYGHSFGGNVLANFLLRKQPKYLKGAILSAPWLKLAKEPSFIELFMAILMNKLIPNFTQNNKIDSGNLSNDKIVCDIYDKDTLVHREISVRLFLDFYKAGKWAIENAEKTPVEILIVHGEDDVIISKSGTKDFVKKSHGKVEYKIFKNTKHELHNDNTKEDVFSYVLNWLDKMLH